MDMDVDPATSSARPNPPEPALAFKGPKRKRLTKACDACHKSKRRCDGTAPCSNCYFASKECTYTDSTGRPVPAPRAALGPSHPSVPPSASASKIAALGVRVDSVAPPPSSAARVRPPSPARSIASTSSRPDRTRRPPPPPPLPPPPLPSQLASLAARAPTQDYVPSHNAEQHEPRKRIRVASALDYAPPPRPHAMPILSLSPPVESLPPPLPPSGSLLDPPVVRELVALFLAHVFPARLIIHAPSFCAALADGRVPPYLLHAVCASAAPLSPRRPASSAPRVAGGHYAAAARTLMFDNHGALIVPRDVSTVQALCLLQNNECVATFPWAPSLDYLDLALQILREDLHIQDAPAALALYSPDNGLDRKQGPEHGNATDEGGEQMRSRERKMAESPMDMIAMECARRCAWLLRLHGITNLQYHSVSIAPRCIDARVPLPADEASFELGLLHQCQPESILSHAPPLASLQPDTAQSEFGHVLRVAEIQYAIDLPLRGYEDGLCDPSGLEATIEDVSQRLSAWENSLSDSMLSTEAAAKTHLAMLDTSANTSAWCYFMAHVLHSCTVLAISDAKRRIGQSADDTWARSRIFDIVNAFGQRASYSLLGLAPLVAFDRHCRDAVLDPQVQTWVSEFEQTWGLRVPVHQASHPAKAPIAGMSPSGRATIDNGDPKSTVSVSVPAPASIASTVLPSPMLTTPPVPVYFRTIGTAFSRSRRLPSSMPTSSSFHTRSPPGTHLALVDAPMDSFTGGDPLAGTSAGAPPPPVSAFRTDRVSGLSRSSAFLSDDSERVASSAGQGGNTNGNSNNNSNAGNKPTGQSLPSLKESGLLECGDAGATMRPPVRALRKDSGSQWPSSPSSSSSWKPPQDALPGLRAPRGMPWLERRAGHANDFY